MSEQILHQGPAQVRCLSAPLRRPTGDAFRVLARARRAAGLSVWQSTLHCCVCVCVCGVGFNLQISLSSLPLYLALSHSVRIFNLYIYQDGWTGFIQAAQNGHLEVVKLLLDKGGDVSQASKVCACVCVRARACACVYVS